MSKAKLVRASVGDVFVIPISDGLRVHGQIIDQSDHQYLVVLFRANNGSMDEVLRSGIGLAGIVFDAKWRNGDWPIIANRPPAKVTPPWFVIGHEQLKDLSLTNFDNSVTRKVNVAKASKHRNRVIANPMALQIAVEAEHHLRDWNDALDPFRELAIELSSEG